MTGGNIGGLDLANYQMPEGEVFAGNASSNDVAELSKALMAGEQTGRETTNSTSMSGAPLKVESLDKTLKLLTFTEQDIVLWKKIDKQKAYNTTEEFNQTVSYGEDRGGFIGEGELPQEEDSTYVRRAQMVKYMGVTKSVSHVLTLTNTVVANLTDQAAREGTLWLLRKLNRSLVYGDSGLVPQEFNGIFQQHAKHDGMNWLGGSLAEYLGSEVVIDMRGKILSEKAIEAAAETITENFGMATDLFAPPKVLSNYTSAFYGNKLIQPATAGQTAMMGQKVPGQVTNFGEIAFNYDIFMRRPAPVTVGGSNSNAGSNHQNAPAVVTGLALTAVTSDAVGKFDSGDAGDYFYGVRAVNRFGKSALVVSSSAVTVVSGGAVDVAFTAGAGNNAATCFEVYRSAKNGQNNKFELAYTVSVAELASGHNGAAANKTRDRNFFIPGTDQCFMIENRGEILAYKQLAPLMRMDLAVISPAYRFMILQYGTPTLFAPKKMVRFINVGEAVA